MSEGPDWALALPGSELDEHYHNADLLTGKGVKQLVDAMLAVAGDGYTTILFGQVNIKDEGIAELIE